MKTLTPSEYLAKIGRKGGKARMKWTPEERKRMATKASRAAAVARAKRKKDK
jgi:hypothetical protein